MSGETATVPDCGHSRHWDDGVQDDGTGDWETCDSCGRLVCFDIDCPNGFIWATVGEALCLPCDKREAIA